MSAAVRVVVILGLLGAVMPVPLAAQEPGGTPVSPYATPVGDLDGDGAADLVQHASVAIAEPPALDLFDYRITARSGRDGEALWTAMFDDRTTVAALSLGGGRGVLAVEDTYVPGSGTGFGNFPPFATENAERTVRLTGLRGDGTVAWQHDAGTGRVARAYVGSGGRGVVLYRDYPVPLGVLHAGAGAADRVAVAILDRVEPWAAAQSTTAVGLLDAATGEVAAERTIEVADARPSPRLGPDLDGDGLDDLVIVSPGDGPEAGVHALAGSDLETLWANTAADVPTFTTMTQAGDLDGDGRTDLLLRGGDSPVITTSGGFGPLSTVLAVAGGTGDTLITTHASTAFPLGDVGGAAGDDLGVVTAIEQGDDALVVINAMDATGADVYSTDYTVPADGASVRLHGPVGDVDADGVQDAAHTLTSGNADESAVVDGRTGLRITQDLPGRALGSRAAGRPAEFAAVDFDGATATAAVLGVDGTTAWRSAPLPLPAGGASPTWVAQAADVTGDGLADVLLQLDAGGDVSVSVLDGVDGRLLWTV